MTAEAATPRPGPGRRRSVLVAALLAALCAGGLFLWSGDMHLNLADEGYLWYGVLGVLDGEVPMRDFQAYDPGRYYWCAALAPLLGDGIVGVRASAALFQALGLFLGLLAARRALPSDAWLVPVSVVLTLWMFPRHKVFEPAIALGACWSLARLLELPSARRHLETGLFVGLAAVFGRNHGLYAGLGALFATWLAVRHLPGAGPALARRLAALSGGVLLGYLPLLSMLAFVPGFAPAFADALADLATKGANIPKPFPWPWALPPSEATGLERVSDWAVEVGFLAPLVVLALGLLRLARTRGPDLVERAAPVACTLVGALYLHHVSVRSDVPHLGQCIGPALLLLFLLPRRSLSRWITAVAAVALSLLAALQGHTTLRWLAPWRGGLARLEEVEVAGDALRLLPAQARTVRSIQGAVGGRLAPEDELLVAPSRPTFYPLLGKRAPIRDIYLFWFASEEDQRAILEALEARPVRWALIVDTAVDDREDLRFSNTHPLVWEALARDYERVPTPGMRADHLLLRRRAP